MCLNHLHVAKSQQMNQRCFSSKFLHLEFRVRDLERCPKRGQNRVCDDPLLFPALLPKPPLSSWYFTALAEVELKSCRRGCCSASLSFKSEQRHQVQSLFFNLLLSESEVWTQTVFYCCCCCCFCQFLSHCWLQNDLIPQRGLNL